MPGKARSRTVPYFGGRSEWRGTIAEGKRLGEGRIVIRISVRGLAKYMTAGPAAQRKILRNYKFPDESEPTAMRLYYREARDCVEAFHRGGNNRPWLRGKAGDLDQLARLTSGRTAQRLRHNARALNQYDAIFGDRQFEVLTPIRMALTLGPVVISATPDLHVRAGRKERIVRLDFAADPTSDDQIKIICQCTFEAAKGRLAEVGSGSVLYLDLARAREVRGARAGARLLRDIEAAALAIEAIWDSIT